MGKAFNIRDRILKRKRFYDEVNNVRLGIARDAALPEARFLLEIVPVMLHFHDPLVPGFREGRVPHGIDCFTLNKTQKEWLLKLTCNKELKEPKEHSIYALYAMGSTATICQGVGSDFDIWVCVRDELSDDESFALSQKCRFITAFCKAFGVEVNLFITRENRFTAGLHDTLDGDNCGSAQNLFLLDEFYRSALRLCGRYIMWFFVDTKSEIKDYKAAVLEIKNSGVFKEDECFDFGSVVNSSPAEYFGSGLWLLYKGIDSPFKAVLKILLMEAYASEYPGCDLLSTAVRDRVQSKGRYSLDIDPYFLLYQKISDFLQAAHDPKRLELARVCFFFKIYSGMGEQLNSAINDDRAELLGKLKSQWGWDEEKTRLLENKDRWRIDYAKILYQDLFSSLVKSYKALLMFSVRHGIEYAITSDDAGVLSRKLYAAFDRYAGKIFVLNAEITSALEEAHLTFVRPGRDSLCRSGWYLYTKAPDDPALLASKAAYVGERLSEVITWACSNGLLTPRTKCHVFGDVGIVTPENIKSLASDIERIFSNRPTKILEADLQRPRVIKSCCIVLNFERDVTLQSMVAGIDVNIGFSLSCGKERMCLVGSVAVIVYNSWGELRVISLPDGEEGIAELLAIMLRVDTTASSFDSSLALRRIEVCSYSRYHRDLIRYDVLSLIKKVLGCKVDRSFCTFYIGPNQYIAKYQEERGVKIVRHHPFLHDDFSLSLYSPYDMRPEFSMQVPPLVDRYASMGIRQYFFAPLEQGWDIYIVNEKNEVEIYPNYVGSRVALVNAINRFYTNQSEDISRSSMHFNLPQYFVLSRDLKAIHPFTIKGDPVID